MSKNPKRYYFEPTPDQVEAIEALRDRAQEILCGQRPKLPMTLRMILNAALSANLLSQQATTPSVDLESLEIETP